MQNLWFQKLILFFYLALQIYTYTMPNLTRAVLFNDKMENSLNINLHSRKSFCSFFFFLSSMVYVQPHILLIKNLRLVESGMLKFLNLIFILMNILCM